MPPEEEEIDEMDDIDKVRDDLQSTKQLLAIELRWVTFQLVIHIIQNKAGIVRETRQNTSDVNNVLNIIHAVI